MRDNRSEADLVPERRRPEAEETSPGTATATANDDDYTGRRVLFLGSGVRGGVLGRLVQPQSVELQDMRDNRSEADLVSERRHPEAEGTSAVTGRG